MCVSRGSFLVDIDIVFLELHAVAHVHAPSTHRYNYKYSTTHNGDGYCLPQVNDAVVHIGDRVGAPCRGRVGRRALNGPVARCARPCPALQLLARVLDPSKPALVVSAPFGDVCAVDDGGPQVAVIRV